MGHLPDETRIRRNRAASPVHLTAGDRATPVSLVLSCPEIRLPAAGVLQPVADVISSTVSPPFPVTGANHPAVVVVQVVSGGEERRIGLGRLLVILVGDPVGDLDVDG
jgi:hypothetical protein